MPSLPVTLQDTARDQLATCRDIATRIASAAECLGREDGSDLRRCFQLANRAIALARKWSRDEDDLVWRPFQIAFLLLALESTAHPDHADREVMDLLWFPTGGGKTEAYLGLIAFLLFHRRLRQDPKKGAGTAAISAQSPVSGRPSAGCSSSPRPASAESPVPITITGSCRMRRISWRATTEPSTKASAAMAKSGPKAAGEMA